METVELPIVDEGATQGDAMQAISAAGSGAIAVQMDDGVSVLPADTILDEDVDQERLGALARRKGITLPDDGFTIRGPMIHVRTDQVLLPSFDAPSGYKECQKDNNHTYPLTYDRNQCWRDKGELRTIYLGD